MGKSSVQTLAVPKSSLTLAVATFRKFFKLQTGKEWEDRDKMPVPKRDPEGNLLPPHEGWYHFEDKCNIFTSFFMDSGKPAGLDMESTLQPSGDALKEQGADVAPSKEDHLEMV